MVLSEHQPSMLTNRKKVASILEIKYNLLTFNQ